MKVVQINATYGNGSTGTIVRDIHHKCLEANIESYVVYFLSSIKEKDIKNGYRIGNKFDRKLHAILCRINGMQGYYSHFITLGQLKRINSIHPDIIHLHNLHSSYINLPMVLRYAAKKDIAVVITLHDCWFYTGGCTHYTHANCNKWKRSCGNCPQRYEEFPALIYDASSKILEDRKCLFGALKRLNVVGVSQWITDEGKQLVFKNAKCITIHNGIDTDFFYPVESDLRKKYNLEGKFIILAPANKWFQSINLDIFDYFANRLDDDMRIVFIGNGVEKRRLTDKMINIGFVSNRESLREIYSAADVMINCTRAESLSLLNVEVQACGTPVITYSNTGVKETVDGKCGFAVEDGNPKAAWNVMMQIKLHTKNKYSVLCQEWVKQKFDKNKNYLKYIGLYKSIVNHADLSLIR